MVAQASDSPAIILGLWALGALVAAISAFTYAELGAAIPRAGGTYAFVERAFGEKLGTFSGMCILVGIFTSLAMMCFIVGEFLVRLGVGGNALGAPELGLLSLLLFCLVNAAGTRISGASMVGLSAAKAIVLLILAVALFGHERIETAPIGEPIETGWLAIATAMMVVTNTYSGWHHVTFYGEDLTSPGRNIPRALFGGILGVTVIYLLINIAMLRVLTPSQMASSILPAADATGIVFGARGDTFITMFGVLSVGAIANLYVLSASRMTFALARSGALPNALSRVEKNGAPLLAMLFSAAIVAVFIVTGSYLSLVTTTSAINQFNMVISMASLYALRRKEPALPRPYRVPAYPWTWLIAFGISLILMVVFVARDPLNALLGFLLVGGLWVLDYAVRWASRMRTAVREG